MENRKVSDIVGAVLVFFILLFVYTKFIGPIPFSVNNINTNKADLFQTQGTGKAVGAPDEALINLGVTQSSSDVLNAQNKTNSITQKIIDGLLDLGIAEKNIKTINYSINPNYSFSGESQRITGYFVTQNLEARTPIGKTNRVVDKATSNGANLIGNLTFTLNDQKKIQLENEARKIAVDNAKKSAEGLSKAAGIRLGKIINVREERQGPILLDAREAVGTPDVSTQTNIIPGETSIEITVILTYETF